MNIAGRPSRSWSPQIIVISVLLHAVVLYAIAVAFHVVPPPLMADEPRTIPLLNYTPPPVTPEVETVDVPRPTFPQRLPQTPPVPPTVAPSPLPPVVGPATIGTPTTFDVRQPILEEPVSRAPIPYPRVAEERQIEGKVLLSVTIMPDGSVRDVRVVSARPAGYFEEAAIRSVSSWRYRKSLIIRTNVIVEIDFVLT